MKRALMATVMAVAAVGGLGTGAAFAETDSAPSEPHCDHTIHNFYCEFDDGYWLSCDFDTDSESWNCTDSTDDRAPDLALGNKR